MNFSDIKKEYCFCTELHAHTSPVSRCSNIPPEHMAKVYADMGASAVVITNHLTPKWAYEDSELTPDEYLSDYYLTRRLGEERGLNVILGAEVRFTENDNDYLVYGIEPDDIEKIMFYLDKGIEAFYKGFKNTKNIILQAHPFRNRMERAPVSALDGIEVFNCHPKHNSRIAVASKYAKENNFIVSGGTDYHDTGDEGLCMMRSLVCPKDSYDVAEILKSRDYVIDIAGSIVLPY